MATAAKEKPVHPPSVNRLEKEKLVKEFTDELKGAHTVVVAQHFFDLVGDFSRFACDAEPQIHNLEFRLFVFESIGAGCLYLVFVEIHRGIVAFL